MSASRAGFGADHRLHTPAEFATVFEHRRVIRGEWFHLHYRPAQGASARLGLVVAKKHARHAVLRNLVKRIARETFRRLRSGLPPMDLALRLARPVAGPIGPELRRAWATEIARLMERLPQ